MMGLLTADEVSRDYFRGKFSARTIKNWCHVGRRHPETGQYHKLPYRTLDSRRGTVKWVDIVIDTDDLSAWVDLMWPKKNIKA